jgi:hypothetical protein
MSGSLPTSDVVLRYRYYVHWLDISGVLIYRTLTAPCTLSEAMKGTALLAPRNAVDCRIEAIR